MVRRNANRFQRDVHNPARLLALLYAHDRAQQRRRLPPDERYQEGFRFDPPADVFLPLQIDPESTNQAHIWYVAGRLRPEATIQQATAELDVLHAQVRARFPETTDPTESVGVLPLRVAMSGNTRLPLLILGGAVAFVL